MTELAADPEAIFAKLSNKEWRMANMHQILDAAGNIVPFVQRPLQASFYRSRHTRNIIPKCRKYGFSTAIVLDYFDDCVFADSDSPVHAAHIDYRDDDAAKKLAMAKLSWERGPHHPNPVIADLWKGIHASNPLVTDNDSTLEWANGSKQEASVSFMGGTPQRLHISEFGPISSQYPLKARQIKRGTFNAVPLTGTFDIETTMEGGTVGECYEVFKVAREAEGHELSQADWKIFFVPWMEHPENRIKGGRPRKQSTADYFRSISQRYGVDVTDPEQQAWYESIFAVQRWDMFTQHPTVIDECLMTGSNASYFEPPGIQFQREQSVGLETQLEYGDIAVQGDIKDFERRSAMWTSRPREVSPFVIIEHPQAGCKYLLWSDFCVGRQAKGVDNGDRDTNAWGIIREGYVHPFTREVYKPQMVASCQPDDRSITNESIRRLVALSIYYGDCLVMPEINNKDDIASRLIAAGVRRMWRQGIRGADDAEVMPGSTRTAEVWGWLTSDTAKGGGTRSQMLENMRDMTMEQQWIASFPWIVEQMSHFIINKDGRAQGAPGKHDDFVTGPAMGLFGLPHATIYKDREAKIGDTFARQWTEMNTDPRGI